MKSFWVKLDLIGMTASLVCAVHCAALPLLLAAGLFSGLSFFALPVFDHTVISGSVVIAILSLVPHYFKSHQNPIPILLATLGFVFILLGHQAQLLSLEVIGTALGATLVASSHFWNWKINKSLVSENLEF